MDTSKDIREKCREEERERIKDIDTNPGGRHMLLGELWGDLIDSV